MTSDPRSSDFSYKKYSLEQLDNWIHDAINCEDLTAQEIYDTIVKCVDDVVNYHKKELSKSTDLLSLLKGHREVDFGVGNDEPWDYTATGEKFPTTTEATQKDWVDFWEEAYYPEEYSKESVREFEAKERDYERKRAQLDAEYEAIKAAGGYEWTPESNHNKYYYDADRNK